MAASIAVVTTHVPGDLKEVIVDITGDTSYPTGGYAISFPGISNAVFVDAQSSSVGHPAVWDYTNKKLKLYTSGGTEVANATNVSTVKIRCAVLGYA